MTHRKTEHTPVQTYIYPNSPLKLKIMIYPASHNLTPTHLCSSHLFCVFLGETKGGTRIKLKFFRYHLKFLGRFIHTCEIITTTATTTNTKKENEWNKNKWNRNKKEKKKTTTSNKRTQLCLSARAGFKMQLQLGTSCCENVSYLNFPFRKS